MSKNTAFSRAAFASGGSSSWADDDDYEVEAVPLPATLPKVEEKEDAAVASPRARERRQSDEYREREHRPRRDYDNQPPRRERRDDRDREDRGHHRAERREREKTPVPDVGPFKLYVGNLPYRITQQEIANFFGDKETLTDIRIPLEPGSDRQKGFAYVEFSTRDALVEALTLDGEQLFNRPVRLDVSAEKERKRQGNGFFDKRADRRGGQDDAPRERPRVQLLPRSVSTENKDGSTPTAPKSNPFGDAKPRDEKKYDERKKLKELEEAVKPKVERATSAGTRDRKHSQDDAEGGRGGRGGGRGGRGRGEERSGRGGGRGGRGDKHERATTATAPASAKKEEPKPKRVQEVKATKIAAPPATKTANKFNILLHDDDSDSD